MAFKDTNNKFSDIAITSRLEKVNSFLKELDSIINFDKLRPILNKNSRGGKNATGSPSYDNVLMFRILLIQKYYIAKEGKSVLVDASLIKSENTQINNKTKEQKSVDKMEVETTNDKLDIQINEELKSKTPS
jgi:hypothetical protein